MGNGSSNRKYTYEQYYQALKQQHGGSMQNISLNLDISQINPYEVLGVTQQSSWDELKYAYRKTALKVHSDKGGSDELFQLVADCFRQVAYDYKMRTSDRPHHELKADSQQYYADRPVMTSREDNNIDGADFHTRFNHAFEKHRLNDDDDARGYAEMMLPSDPKRPDVSIERRMNAFNSNKFHQLFEKEVPVRKELVVYKEPEPLLMAKKLAFTELGGKTEDFSSEGEKHSLQYTDYLKAHSTSRLMDPNAVKRRKEYRNVEEYESARAKVISKPLTEKEQARVERRKQQEEDAERIRLQRLKERDLAIAKHFERVTQLQIGSR